MQIVFLTSIYNFQIVIRFDEFSHIGCPVNMQCKMDINAYEIQQSDTSVIDNKCLQAVVNEAQLN